MSGMPVAAARHAPQPPDSSGRRSSLSLNVGKHFQHRRRASVVELEDPARDSIAAAAAVKIEARKRRLLTSADAMFQQRECFSGVMEGKFKFERANPAVLHMMQADVFKGMWSCCRKINANDIGCTQATGHNIKKPRCAQCGQHFNLVTGKHKGYTADKDEACLFHPGTLETSRSFYFMHVAFSCCSQGLEAPFGLAAVRLGMKIPPWTRKRWKENTGGAVSGDLMFPSKSPRWKEAKCVFASSLPLHLLPSLDLRRSERSGASSIVARESHNRSQLLH